MAFITTIDVLPDARTALGASTGLDRPRAERRAIDQTRLVGTDRLADDRILTRPDDGERASREAGARLEKEASRQQVIAPELLEGRLPETVAIDRPKDTHLLGDLVVARSVPSNGLLKVLDVLHLDADEAELAARFARDEDVERRVVAGESRIAASGRVLEVDADDAQVRTDEQALEDSSGEHGVSLQLSEQVEAERLRREEVLEDPRCPIELALAAQGIKHLGPHDVPHGVGQEIRERVLREWHRETRTERSPAVLTDRETAALAPLGLAKAGDALERVVRADQRVMRGEELVGRRHREIMYDRGCGREGRTTSSAARHDGLG